MLLMLFIVNLTIFFTVLNFSWIINKGYNYSPREEIMKRVGIPVFLSLLLTLLDSWRVAFFYKIFVFIALSVGGYLYYRYRFKKKK